MVALKIFFGTECRRCNTAPTSFTSLTEYIFTITGLSSPLIQYQDEENDLITITTEIEYQDFISFSTNIAKLLVSPSKIEQSCNTFPVFTKSSASLAAPATIEQSISTRVVTEDKSQGMLKPNTHEIGCDAQENINKIIETIPLETSSVLSGPSEVQTSDKFTKTKNNLLDSIRNIIREEVNKGQDAGLKVSGITLKHFGVQCSNCKVNPIVGIRYKCSQCEVNYCEQCEYSQDHPHPFFKVRMPEGSKEEPKKVSFKEEEEKKYFKVKKPIAGNGFERYEKNIKNVIEMGFTYDQALSALIASNNNLEVAVENLIFSQKSS